MEANALELLSEISVRYSSLVIDSPTIPPLVSADEDTMWSLVDYSTVSSSIKYEHKDTNKPTFLMDLNGTWFDLFGNMSSTRLDTAHGTSGDVLGDFSTDISGGMPNFNAGLW
jgi:hypothetical protein